MLATSMALVETPSDPCIAKARSTAVRGAPVIAGTTQGRHASDPSSLSMMASFKTVSRASHLVAGCPFAPGVREGSAKPRRPPAGFPRGQRSLGIAERGRGCWRACRRPAGLSTLELHHAAVIARLQMRRLVLIA